MTTPGERQAERDDSLSWWLAAGIVGADIGTSVFYSTQVVMPFVGFAAPLVIAFVCLLMWFFKATYEEGCSASPFNGGAYMMTLQTIGRRAAMIVGSLCLLSYLATAAVSAISGAYYMDSLDNLNDWPEMSVVVAAAVPVVLFGILNIVGIKEPAKIVFVIAAFHFGLLLFMDFYGLWLAFEQKADFTKVFHGWEAIPPQTFMFGIAAAFLGITGFESAAEFIEQLRTPTWRTLKKVYLVVVVLVGLTAPLTSYLCIILLNDHQLSQYKNNLLSGLAVVEGGPLLLNVLVTDACLTLFAAVNTAYAGAIGLCTTMAKQGNLPPLFLHRWSERIPVLQGYPYVALAFMALTLGIIATLPGRVAQLAQIYGMAFLAVMISFCVGVLLLRVRMPLKVARSPYKTSWTLHIGGLTMPVPALIGCAALVFAEVNLIAAAHDVREMGFFVIAVILLVMFFYRISVLEARMSELPDLRLGFGSLSGLAELPKGLPTSVVCVAGVKARALISTVLQIVNQDIAGEKELIIFHSEETNTSRDFTFELLQRVVSQQIAPLCANYNIVLTVKILPEPLLEGLTTLKKAVRFETVFLGVGQNPRAAAEFARLIESSLAVPVRVVKT